MSSTTSQTYAETIPGTVLARRALDQAPQPGLVQTRATEPSVARSMAALSTAEPVSGMAGKARIARAMQHMVGNARIARMGCATCGEDAGEQE